MIFRRIPLFVRSASVCTAPWMLELALHDGCGLEAPTTQQESANFGGSNFFGDLVLLVVFLANIKSACNPTRKERLSGTLAILLLLEAGVWLVPVVEASHLLGCLVLVLVAHPARPPASNAGSPPMGAGAVTSRCVSSRASARRRGSVGRFGSAPRLARIFFLLMAFAFLGITSAKPPPPPFPCALGSQCRSFLFPGGMEGAREAPLFCPHDAGCGALQLHVIPTAKAIIDAGAELTGPSTARQSAAYAQGRAPWDI